MMKREETDRDRGDRGTTGGERESCFALGAPQRQEQRIHVRKALLGIRIEAAHQELAQPARQLRGIELGGATTHFGLELLDRLAIEGACAGERFPQCDAEAELIGGGTDDATRPLFRRHVRGRAEHRAGGGEAGEPTR